MLGHQSVAIWAISWFMNFWIERFDHHFKFHIPRFSFK
jgi:hypothetical protein